MSNKWEFSFKNIFYKQRSRSFLQQFDKLHNQFAIPITASPLIWRSQGAYRVTIQNLDASVILAIENTTGQIRLLPRSDDVIDTAVFNSEPYLPKDDEFRIWFITDSQSAIGEGFRIYAERYVKKGSKDPVLQY